MKRTSLSLRAVKPLLISLGTLLGACGGELQLPDVGEIEVQPSERIPVGETAALTVPASGTGLAFQWSADQGELSATANPSAVYKAPLTPGRATVTVQVTGDGGSVVRSKTFEIIDKPAAPAPSAEAVTLTSHQDEQTVPCTIVAKGKYSPDVTEAIWPVVLVAGVYHPQGEGGKAPPRANGGWSGTVRFGDCTKPEETSGQPFLLLVVTADEAANRAFESYIKQGTTTGFPGMPELPDGATEHVRILVTRD